MMTDMPHSLCTPEDSATLLGIESAMHQIAADDYAFGYYDLGISAEEWDLLHALRIEYRGDFPYMDSILGLQPYLCHIIEALSPSNAPIASQAATIITHAVQNVVDASTFDSALVVIKAEPARTHPPTPGWHIDKTFQEFIDKHTVYDQQWAYLFTVKGPSTLYYQANATTHAAFLEGAVSPYFSFGCDGMATCQIAELIDTANINTASPGQGSVHHTGKMRGTIHANAPAYAERLVVIVTPNPQDRIDAYYQALEHLYSR